MTSTTTYKKHSLHLIQGVEFIPFEPSDYSKFKYGSKSIARKFGRELGRMLARRLPIDRQIVVIPAPYNFIPTATFALKDYVIAELNKHLIERGMSSPIQEAKIFRPASYNTDYGNMSLEERRSAIGSEQFHVDKEFLQGKLTLFLDDIRVTGAHEERIVEMIERLDLQCDCEFVYFANVDQSAAVDPKIENFLNLYSMRSLLDLDKIIKNDEFIFNTRNVKFILHAGHEEFKNFINYQRKKFRETLYSNLLGNGYHMEDKYVSNVSYLKELLKNN